MSLVLRRIKWPADGKPRQVVGFRKGLHVLDGDFYNEFSATDILLGPGDLART
jgi:hypothetical protein